MHSLVYLMNNSELWSAYQQVVFELIDRLPQVAHFMIITADYPQGRALTSLQRENRQQQLHQTLMHYSNPCRLYGCSVDLSHRELSFATSDMDLSEALKIARDYNQNAIYEVVDNQLYLHPCLIAFSHKVAVGAFDERIVKRS